MLEVKNITFSYSNSEVLLKDVSLSVDKGEIVGLVAPSGYGKSTLGQIIGGYIRQSSGEIIIDGKNLKEIKGFCPVQMIHQHPEKSINPNWKIRKILNEAFEVSDEIQKDFGIENFWLNKFPSELSGGELQRICIARILNDSTKYIVADEITTMLDSINQVQIITALKKYVEKSDLGILFISHNYELLSRIANRVVYLDKINKR